MHDVGSAQWQTRPRGWHPNRWLAYAVDAARFFWVLLRSVGPQLRQVQIQWLAYAVDAATFFWVLRSVGSQLTQVQKSGSDQFGVIAGCLASLADHSVPSAVLWGGGGAGGSLLLFHTIVGR